MSDKLLQLGTEAKNLILEFKELESIIGAPNLKSIEISSDGKTITIEDLWPDQGVEVFELTDISATLRGILRGPGACCSGMLDCVEEEINFAEDIYKEKDKNEYIAYMGGLHYMLYRCEEIYQRLKEIDTEATTLIG